MKRDKTAPGKSQVRPPIASAIAILVALVSPFFAASSAAQQKEQTAMPEFEGKMTAPDFPGGAEWLNTERPLSIRDLRGKVVVLDFWTYCCINCMHVIPDLKKLEKKYASELVVIGVHSAKFTTERETDNIRQAILRYEIEHPVINDRDMQVWREYTVHSWPTLFVIDPVGKIVGFTSGEGVYEPFDKIIGKVIETFDAKKLIDRKPLKLRLERHRSPSSVLSFPGKVLADAPSNQLFISDSNHNRIVSLSLSDSSVKEVIGNGEIGIKDGGFDEASFNHPQGMALDGKKLYVADTENHAIRLVDLEKRTVMTLAGNGEQSHIFGGTGGPGKTTKLNSPWDLVFNNGSLYIAMAGPHQLWKLDLKTNEIHPYAGNGRERRNDGPLDDASLAQPSGITTDGKKLYFADSEVSSIRSADLDPKGSVETIVGGDLFEFGDRDGKGLEARLQHPLGVVYHDGAVYVADTYNNRIKRVNPADQTLKSFVGTGEPGLRDGEKAKFDEPGGLSVANGNLYVADTNNHVIRVVDIRTGRVSTLNIAGMEKLAERGKARPTAETVELPEQVVAPGEATLTVRLELPSGFKLNPLAPSALKLTSAAKQSPEGAEQSFKHPQFPITVPVNVAPGQASVQAEFVIYYCETQKESLCYFKDVAVKLRIRVDPRSSNRKLALTYEFNTP